jgi:NAD(P)-dependent dehydrogenase (short-subunit alcohol dehydrogenase family)
MDGLLGRTVLLTGANGGIGVVAVQRFLDSGANVVCQYRSSKKNLESLEEKVSSHVFLPHFLLPLLSNLVQRLPHFMFAP